MMSEDKIFYMNIYKFNDMFIHLAVIIALSICVISVSGCQSGSNDSKSLYGEDFSTGDYLVVEIAQAVNQPDQFTDDLIIVEGRIMQVCPTAGCWLIMTDGTNNLLAEFYDFSVNLPNQTEIAVLGEIRFRQGQPYLAGRGIRF